MPLTPDSPEFEVLKRFYPWLGDDQLALLQTFYQTWRQLADANGVNLHKMLSGIRTPDSPVITLDQVYIIQAFASEKARLQEEETT